MWFKQGAKYELQWKTLGVVSFPGRLLQNTKHTVHGNSHLSIHPKGRRTFYFFYYLLTSLGPQRRGILFQICFQLVYLPLFKQFCLVLFLLTAVCSTAGIRKPTFSTA